MGATVGAQGTGYLSRHDRGSQDQSLRRRHRRRGADELAQMDRYKDAHHQRRERMFVAVDPSGKLRSHAAAMTHVVHRRRPRPPPGRNPSPRSATDLLQVTRRSGGCDCGCAFGCARGGGSEPLDVAPRPARRPLMTYRRGGIGFIRRIVARGKHPAPRRLEPPGWRPPSARPAKVECAGGP